MSVPSFIFVDTSIFDQQNYNFSSSAFRPFLAAVAGKSFSLILPDPTLREVRRHIAERADAVVKALEESGRKAPFVTKFKDWPLPGFALSWEIRRLGMNEWKAFLDHFSVRTLALESANLSQVMLWYEEQQSPFGPKKKKEFPDALAFSSLLACAREHHATIAVIAADPDFRLACKRFSEVLHFPSLPAFTEALIAGDIHVKKMRHIFEADSSLLSAAVETEISTLHFFPAADPDDGRAEGVKALEVAFDEFHVVAVGDEECMIAFDAAVRYSILVAFDDPDSAIVDSSEGIFHKHRRFSGIVEDQASLSGTAKIKLSKDWSAFEEVTYFEFSGQEVEVTETPPEEWPFDEPY